MSDLLKNRLLVAGVILVFFACYKLSIANTFDLRSQYEELTKEQMIFKNTPRQLALLKKKEMYYDSLLQVYRIGETSLQNNLLQTINGFAEENSLKVIDFLEPHIYVTESLTTKTYSFTLEGHFNTILQLIYLLEQQTKYGEIISFHYKKKKDYKTDKVYLQAHVLLQSLS